MNIALCESDFYVTKTGIVKCKSGFHNVLSPDSLQFESWISSVDPSIFVQGIVSGLFVGLTLYGAVFAIRLIINLVKS